MKRGRQGSIDDDEMMMTTTMTMMMTTTTMTITRKRGKRMMMVMKRITKTKASMLSATKTSMTTNPVTHYGVSVFAGRCLGG